MKSIEHYFITLYKVVLAFESVDEILSVIVQIKGIQQYFILMKEISPLFPIFNLEENVVHVSELATRSLNASNSLSFLYMLMAVLILETQTDLGEQR